MFSNATYDEIEKQEPNETRAWIKHPCGLFAYKTLKFHQCTCMAKSRDVDEELNIREKRCHDGRVMTDVTYKPVRIELDGKPVVMDLMEIEDYTDNYCSDNPTRNLRVTIYYPSKLKIIDANKKVRAVEERIHDLILPSTAHQFAWLGGDEIEKLSTRELPSRKRKKNYHN